jgi:hypothetical protein
LRKNKRRERAVSDGNKFDPLTILPRYSVEQEGDFAMIGFRRRTLIILIVTLGAVTAARADQVPAHLASMAAELYAEARKTLDDPRMPPERRAIAERTVETLKQARIRYWAREPVSLAGAAGPLAETLGLDLSKEADRSELARLLAMKEDEARQALQPRFSDEAKLNEALAALSRARAPAEDLATSHAIDVGGGETVELDWQPESGHFLVRSRGEGRAGAEAYESALIGNTALTPNPETGALDVSVAPAEDPLRLLSARDIERIRGSIFGEWLAADGERWVFAAADGNERAGDIRRSPAEIRRDIETTKARLQEIEDAKEYLWEDEAAGEIVRQRRFRKLGEPWVYKGEQYITADAETKIAELQQQIADLEAELSGESLPPVTRHDPVGFEAASRGGASPVAVTVTGKNGYSYRWDEASFDGRHIRGRRTYRDIRDTKEELPMEIRRQLIASWAPPGWFEIEATVDLATGDIGLTGQRWALHVTYTMGGMFGGDPAVESIHTPFSQALDMSKAGELSKMAYGAADTALP